MLTVDGVGEWATTTFGRAGGPAIDLFEEVDFPSSLGLLYSTLDLLSGLRGQRRGVQGDGARSLRRAALRRPGAGPGEPGRGRPVPPQPRVLRLPAARPDVLGSPDRALRSARPGRPSRSSWPSITTSPGASSRCSRRSSSTRWRTSTAGCPAATSAWLGESRSTASPTAGSSATGRSTELFVQPAASDAGGCLGAAALAHVRLTGERPGAGPARPHVLGSRDAGRRHRGAARRDCAPRPGLPRPARRAAGGGRRSAGGGQGRGLVPGPHGVRTAGARREVDPGGSSRPRDARPHQRPGQDARELPSLRPGRPRPAGAGALRHRPSLAVHAGDLPGRARPSTCRRSPTSTARPVCRQSIPSRARASPPSWRVSPTAPAARSCSTPPSTCAASPSCAHRRTRCSASRARASTPWSSRTSSSTASPSRRPGARSSPG